MREDVRGIALHALKHPQTLLNNLHPLPLSRLYIPPPPNADFNAASQILSHITECLSFLAQNFLPI
jgi:hypothetical protein